MQRKLSIFYIFDLFPIKIYITYCTQTFRRDITLLTVGVTYGKTTPLTLIASQRRYFHLTNVSSLQDFGEERGIFSPQIKIYG